MEGAVRGNTVPEAEGATQAAGTKRERGIARDGAQVGTLGPELERADLLHHAHRVNGVADGGEGAATSFVPLAPRLHCSREVRLHEDGDRAPLDTDLVCGLDPRYPRPRELQVSHALGNGGGGLA